MQDIDLSKNDCPLAEKCPYYKEFKDDPTKLKECPATKGCPHYKGHDHHAHDSGNAAKKPIKAAGKPKAEEHDEL